MRVLRRQREELLQKRDDAENIDKELGEKMLAFL